MKAAIVCCIVVVVAVAAQTNSARLYDEKSDAIDAIVKKQNEVNEFSQKVEKDVKDEEAKIPTDEISKSKESGRAKAKDITKSLDKEIIKAVRSGIARGKSLNEIDCILNVAADSKVNYQKAVKEHEKTLDGLVVVKTNTLSTSKTENEAIKTALNELVVESKNRINNATTGIENLKKDGIKKCSTATNILLSIIKRIPVPDLKKQIFEQDTAMKSKFDKLLETSIKTMQKCVA